MFFQPNLTFLQRRYRECGKPENLQRSAGTAGQPTPTTGGSAAGEGGACFIDDSLPPIESDELVEEIKRGTVFSIFTDAIDASQSSPYLKIAVASTLKPSAWKVSARGCANTGSRANFCPVQHIEVHGYNCQCARQILFIQGCQQQSADNHRRS